MLSLLRILENMQQGVMLLDADLQVVAFNGRAGELLQAPKDGIEVGLSATRLADQIPVLAITPKSGTARESWVTHVQTRSTTLRREISIGSRVILLTTAPIEEGGWLVTCDDISALATIRRDLADQNSRFDAALANMPHGFACSMRKRSSCCVTLPTHVCTTCQTRSLGLEHPSAKSSIIAEQPEMNLRSGRRILTSSSRLQ